VVIILNVIFGHFNDTAGLLFSLVQNIAARLFYLFQEPGLHGRWLCHLHDLRQIIRPGVQLISHTAFLIGNVFRPQHKFQDLQAHVHQIRSDVRHPVKKCRCRCRSIIDVSVLNLRKQLLLQFHRIVSGKFAADRQIIHMSHTARGCHQCIQRLGIGL
jgi:hypothetical protein